MTSAHVEFIKNKAPKTVMKRKIHIWDLPIEKVYIKLKDNFRKDFFNKAHKKFNNWRLLGDYLDVKRGDTLLAKNWKKGNCCCPLNIILKIGKLTKISKYEIEKNISEIKYKTRINKRGGSSGKPIINPKLPIKVNEDFAEILGHICGDGTVNTDNPKKGIGVAYINSEYTLIKSFNKKMKRIFGEIEPKIYVRDGLNYRRPNYYVQYPSIIALFVLSIFDYKVNEGMDIPLFIFQMSKKAKARFLRAIFDDEGSVSENNKNITFSLKPIKPLKNIVKLLNEFNIRTGSIHTGNDVSRFGIAEQNSILNFQKFISFEHPKKIKRLDNIIKTGWKFKRYYNGEAKEKIIVLLKENQNLNTKEISEILQRNKTTVKMHLNNLKEEGKIFNQRENNKNSIIDNWFIKNG